MNHKFLSAPKVTDKKNSGPLKLWSRRNFFRMEPARAKRFLEGPGSQQKYFCGAKFCPTTHPGPGLHPVFSLQGQPVQKHIFLHRKNTPLQRKTDRENRGFFHFQHSSSGFEAICQKNTYGNPVFPGLIYTDFRRTEAKMDVFKNDIVIFHDKITSREVRQDLKRELSDGE